MGTFETTGDANLVSQDWCTDGVVEWQAHPKDPDAYYLLDPPVISAWYWMHTLSCINSAKAKAVVLASVQDLSDGLSAGDDKTRLAALAAETADAAAYVTWYDAGRGVDRRKVRHTIGACANYLNTDTTFGALRTARLLCATKAETDGITLLAASKLLVALWRTRCTVTEYKNGLT